MSKLSHADRSAAYIKEKYPQFKPKIGIVLGSGLGTFADTLEDKITIPYADLYGFPQGTIHGHAGQMVLGHVSGVDVLCLQGRAHRYEGQNDDVVKTYVRTIQRLGAEYFFAVSACGSLKKESPPGSLMLIHDHINFQMMNPLIGPNDDEFGPRFFPVDQAYDPLVRSTLKKIAAQENIPLPEGVYISVYGPNYETAAEIRAFQQLGADAVGMSTVGEVLVAVHCGLRVGVIGMMTNYATGIATESHNHDAVVDMAARSSHTVHRLLHGFIQTLR